MLGEGNLVAREALPSKEKRDGSAPSRLSMRGDVDLLAREAAPSEEKEDGSAASCPERSRYAAAVKTESARA
jgi:hypothetical protein